MPWNFEPDMVIKSYDGWGVAGGIRGVARGSVEVAWGIDGIAGVGGIESVGRSLYYTWSGCVGIGDAGLGGDSYLPIASIGQEWNALDNGGDAQDGAQ